MSISSHQGNTDRISQDTSGNNSTWQLKISHDYLQFLARSSCDSHILLNTVISQHKQQQTATNTAGRLMTEVLPLLECKQCPKSLCAQKTCAHCSHITGGNHVHVNTYRSWWGQYHSIPQQQQHLPTQLLPWKGSYFFCSSCKDLYFKYEFILLLGFNIPTARDWWWENCGCTVPTLAQLTVNISVVFAAVIHMGARLSLGCPPHVLYH